MKSSDLQFLIEKFLQKMEQKSEGIGTAGLEIATKVLMLFYEWVMINDLLEIPDEN